MRKTMFVSILAALILSALVVFLQAGDEGHQAMKKEAITIEGTLVDAKCYLSAAVMGKPAMNFGNDHMVQGKNGKMMSMANCATACANMGIPVAVVEGGKPGGKTTIIIAPAGMLAQHMTKNARVTGKLTDAGIVAIKVEVKENGKWVEAPITSMM